MPVDVAQHKSYTTLQETINGNNQKYDYASKDAAENPEIRSLRPRYNDIKDGLERDNRMYLEEEKNLFYASVLTMTTLLISAIYISSR
jgi:hypothetical protein